MSRKIAVACVGGMLVLAGNADSAGSVAVAEPAAETACAAGKPLRHPVFPVAMVRAGQGGSVALDLRVDECGRIIGADVVSSTRAEFTEAALASIQDRRLDQRQRAQVVDGRYRWTVDFHKPEPLQPAPIDWPATHGAPQYRWEESARADDFATAAEASDGVPNPPGLFWPTPFRISGSRFVQQGEPGKRVFWYFLSRDGDPLVALRYRPVIEQGAPVVRMTMWCDAEDGAVCRHWFEVAAEGLPFAKAGNTAR